MPVSQNDIKALVREAPADCSPFLTTAQVVTTVFLSTKGLDPSLLDEITKYLGAHFCSLYAERGGFTRSRLGESDEYYRQVDGKLLGFNSTRYGQMAISLDTSGTLQNLSAPGPQVMFEVIKTRQDQLRTRVLGAGGWWWM